MYKITKEFHFSASHILDGLPTEHPCSRLHGHNYVIKIEIEAVELDGPGFVIDYRALGSIKEFIDSQLDHSHLNDELPGNMNPTAENIAKFMYDVSIKELHSMRSTAKVKAVEVSETPKTNARYEV